MQIYNSLTNKKETFKPLESGKIKMYVCGQTVYDYCHLGHARKSIVFDMIRRWFLVSDYEVLFVENITDIDDKIIARANENGESTEELTTRFIDYMYQDFDRLGVMRADVQPKATEYVAQMLVMIDDLVAKGYAYHANNGDVYYRVNKFDSYGKLSGKSLDSLRSGERVDIDKNKENPLDFVLWKTAKTGEPSWESKYGSGRPGWHIECSAMAKNILGNTFDIHGGGQDLQFPHHENEIAQSEACNNCTFANYWLHNGFLNINDEKMSKSLGNFFTLRDLLDKYNPEVIRLFMLKTHYRSPLNFTETGLEEAKNNLTKVYSLLSNHELKNTDIDWNNDYAKRFQKAMNDDFNTPLAWSVVFELIAEINKTNNHELIQLLVNLLGSLGLLQQSADDFLQNSKELLISESEINSLIEQRDIARKNKDYILSDTIRDKLLNLGIELKDSNGKTIWQKI